MPQGSVPGRYPMEIAMDYFDSIEANFIAPAREPFEREVQAGGRIGRRLRRILGDSALRTDRHEEKIEKVLEELENKTEFDRQQARRLAKDEVQQTRTFAINQTDRQVAAIAGVRPHLRHPRVEEAMQAALEENVRLITTIETRYHDEVERVIRQGIVEGRGIGEIENGVYSAGRKATNNARLIARDQVGNVFGRVQKERQQQLGIEEFVWRTVGDNRVRDEHEQRDGNRYKWEDPPAGEFPGDPIQCRCWAEPAREQVLANWGEAA